MSEAKTDFYWLLWNEWHKQSKRPIAEGDNRTIEYIKILDIFLKKLFLENGKGFDEFIGEN